MHIWNDIPYPITCGDVLYINADDRHGYESVNNLRLDNILYHRDKLAIRSAIEQYLSARSANEIERLCRAMMLLRNASHPISNIAAECGYEDSNYFPSICRKITELRSTEYRARFTKNN